MKAVDRKIGELIICRWTKWNVVVMRQKGTYALKEMGFVEISKAFKCAVEMLQLNVLK